MTTAARIAEMERSLNGMAKKVLDAIPVAEPWRLAQIFGEMERQGRTVDRRVFDGCLGALKNQGLVREPEPGAFIRVTARVVRLDRKPSEETMPAVKTPPPVAAPPQPAADASPMDRLAAVAQCIRTLAGEVEAIALDVAEREQTTKADLQKLHQLQALLRGI